MTGTVVALRKVLNVWGISAEDKLDAIRLILDGVDHVKVVSATEEISNGLGALMALKPGTPKVAK